MKTILISIAAITLLAAAASAQPAPHYKVIDLGPLPGGNFAQASGISNNGAVSGVSSTADGTQHAVLWLRSLGLSSNIGKGSQNSAAFGINEKGEVAIQAESSDKDPNNENFCAWGTGLKCLPYMWRGGVMTPLPLLGGNNGTVGQINNRGEIAGLAETGTRDTACPAKVAVNGTGPQVLDFKPVIWGPARDQIRQLSLPQGDTVGMAMWVNDRGQATGITGTCANTLIPPSIVGPHAVLWEKDGSATDLGSLGGTVNIDQMFIGNATFVVNNAGQVVGASPIPPQTGTVSTVVHAFLWTRGVGMQDLGTLPGDVISAALALNDRGDVAGASVDAEFNPRPFVWQNGTMIDLNAASPGSPLYLLLPASMNAGGEIVGFGATHSGDIHGFVAVPDSSPATGKPHAKQQARFQRR